MIHLTERAALRGGQMRHICRKMKLSEVALLVSSLMMVQGVTL